MESVSVLIDLTRWRRPGVLAVLLVFCVPLSTPAWEMPASKSHLTPYVAEYKVKISVLGGRLHTRFETTEYGYTAESIIEATGMSRILAGGEIREHSWFSAGADGIRPQQYRSIDSISSDHDNVALDFNWDALEVTGLIDGEDFQAPLESDDVQDRVSLQYRLMYDLKNGGAEDTYYLQDAEDLKLLEVTRLESKTVKVPYGSFEVIGVQHRRQGSSRVTTLWCARELDYLPVIIEQHRKGKLRMRAILQEYTPIADRGTDSVADTDAL